MLEVSLRHRFPGFALDAAFAAPTPGVTALFGPSGCGKSTVLAAVAGLLRPEAGRVALGGQVLLDTGRGIMLPPERRRCGVVFQDARLFPHLSVETNLRYGQRRAPPGTAGLPFAEVVDLLGIGHLLGRRPAALSGGEKQRVALGRALLSRPALLLMDEPLAALDAARKLELLPFLARLRDRLSIPMLYVTHALDEVDQLADTLVLMQQGRVLACDTLEALSARTDLSLLAGRRDAGVVLHCTVLAHAPERGLTRLGFPGGELLVPLDPAPPGMRLRVRVRARDVSVAMAAPPALSMQNVLPAIVEAVDPGAPHEALLRLRVGGAVLLSRVTLDAVRRLGLAPGQAVWAMVKSVAFSRGGEVPVAPPPPA
ncbi:molybdenum ABC transporter ATP-binding protein [Teichococcus oryzae]|uniref:Molybdenum ABC transporter ATP-binding protein n=1 Tax=Teichococcus oryzae TaxID=1608942 RepID=A0A5B2TEN7_9PROT|nr:molybdenum ABC transporter ATP-binding protein [Pseudoroseomonas oryzae]KAA2212495.1 molybdenum ABC transporter ATP-binding protein [Pseudoroseomonas oryzae]